MELVWEDPPVPDTPFFTRDLYEKYSLAPNIRELWAFLQSPLENTNIKQGCDVGAAKASCSPSTEDAAEFKDNSCISKEESFCDSSDSDDPYADSVADGEEECKDTRKSRVKLKQVENEPGPAFPEPRLPFPCMSTLSSKDQKTYLGFLMRKKSSDPPQNLKGRVNNEVIQFMRYLQAVAKMCADDYNFISQGAMQYSEDFFRGCLECIKTFPQFYQIHEMTSLTGGTFNPGLNLTFEKQLLIMGNVDITDHKIVPADAQLASDYQSVSSENPPAKKAKDMHANISRDGNAEKLCARYEPHVCLTRDALVKLLDNHGPDFGEPWELPVWIKVNPEKGSSQKKTVYIDSPLLKTEMTVRERSHCYHEESLKLSIKNNGSKNVFHLMTELPANEQQLSPESSQRNPVCFENNGLDFEVDLTDLETFGETTPIKAPKKQKIHNEQDASVETKNTTSAPTLSKSERASEHLANTSSSSLEEMNTSLRVMDDPMRKEAAQPVVSESSELVRQDSAQESDQDLGFAGDSEDEKLVIDVSVSPAPSTQPEPISCSSDPPLTPVSKTDPVNSDSSSPQKVPRRTRQSKRSKAGDQLGEILRMQTAMFNSANDTGKCSTISQETNSPSRTTGPSVHSHQTSLVKPCVSSYLERNQNQDGETCTAPHTSAPVVNNNTTEHKKILSQDLQASAEDEQDYKAPEKGNLLYKLYSLQDLLVMVRSSVSLTHSRKVGSGQNQHVPVHVLPKLEYQMSYGVECLTSSEACQLWTETLLHSSTVSYIAHINAHTSKVALLRKLPDDWKQNVSCGFKPSKSLNILHHLLKKLTGLDKGQYLIVHKAGEPFVTLLKAAKVSRGSYSLQQLHSSVPQPPASGLVPWIPVDPAVVLPFHRAHGRVPCTFPPKPFQKATKDGSSQSNSRGAGQSNNLNTGGNTKKKKSKRAARRKKFMKKLIQKSI
ncbi:little elongation complex subunit 2-like [Seriola lalandi dorsalis]|uniref:Interactor of little elongation complex ELL subunit 2 n=4 Tax=Seriola TaxID=8160 RepID=A0A3B4YVC4_SERLL|nr:little elongation complex subunit 2-like [Seriola lalandi dorsalis]XP_056243606.1 little elongation complex subunit 2 isoform X1 [Seriola aureovittata]